MLLYRSIDIEIQRETKKNDVDGATKPTRRARVIGLSPPRSARVIGVSPPRTVAVACATCGGWASPRCGRNASPEPWDEQMRLRACGSSPRGSSCEFHWERFCRCLAGTRNTSRKRKTKQSKFRWYAMQTFCRFSHVLVGVGVF